MNKLTTYLIWGVFALMIAYLPMQFMETYIDQPHYQLSHSTPNQSNNPYPTLLPFRSTSLEIRDNSTQTISYESNSPSAYLHSPAFSNSVFTHKQRVQSTSSAPSVGYNEYVNYARMTYNKEQTLNQQSLPAIRIVTAQSHSAAYIPFGNTTPSEATAQAIDNQTTPSSIRGRQNAFITPDDPGDRSEQAPIGDPCAMLLFATIAAGYTYLHQSRKE